MHSSSSSFWTAFSHYVELDSPSYTGDSKISGSEHIRFSFSCSLSLLGDVSVVCWHQHQHHRRLELSNGRPLRLRSLVAR